MPQGSVLEPDGPDAQKTFGQVYCTNGKIYLFHNTAKLEVNDPVIFDIHAGNAKVDIGKKECFTGKLAVAVLPKNYDKIGKDGKWTDPSLNERWEKEWNSSSEFQLKNVNLDRQKVKGYGRFKKPKK